MPAAGAERTIAVVGLLGGRPVGADAEAAVRAATLVAGSVDQLAATADLRGADAITAVVGGGLAALDAVVAHDGPACVLASGDPGFFGIARALRARLNQRGLTAAPDGWAKEAPLLATGEPSTFGAPAGSSEPPVADGLDAQIRTPGPSVTDGHGVGVPGAPSHRPVVVHPAPSSVALAFARAGVSWDGAVVRSCHAGVVERVVAEVARAPAAAVLCGPDAPPEVVAAALMARGAEHPLAVVAARLAEPDEQVTVGDLRTIAAGSFPHRAVLVVAHPQTTVDSAVRLGGRPVEVFAHRAGMITKPEVRSVVLGKLDLPGTGVMWDLGAGSASVAVEAALAAPGLRVIAVERNEDDADRAVANAAALGAPVEVAHGELPAALVDLPDPDRVFVGGGGLDVLDAAWDRLRPGGWLVASFAAVDRAAEAHHRLGSLVQVSVDRADTLPDGGVRFAADNPVFVAWGHRPPIGEPESSGHLARSTQRPAGDHGVAAEEATPAALRVRVGVTVAVGVGCSSHATAAEVESVVREALEMAPAAARVATVLATVDRRRNHPAIRGAFGGTLPSGKPTSQDDVDPEEPRGPLLPGDRTSQGVAGQEDPTEAFLPAERIAQGDAESEEPPEPHLSAERVVRGDGGPEEPGPAVLPGKRMGQGDAGSEERRLLSFPASALAAVDVPTPSGAVAEAVGTPSVAEAAALLAAGPGARLVVAKHKGSTATAAVAVGAGPTAVGRVTVVGLGPGAAVHRTPAAVTAVRRADAVVGYGTYVDAVAELLRPEQRIVRSAMGDETDRAEVAAALAAAGWQVALVSSGDAGVFAMASTAIEAASDRVGTDGGPLCVDVVPGVTAAHAGAAAVGAPLAGAHAAVTLSDILVPWERIDAQLRAAASSGMALALYNPRSKGRPGHLARALTVLGEVLAADTPVAIVTGAGDRGEQVQTATLATVDPSVAGMRSVVLVGTADTTVDEVGRMVTARHHPPSGPVRHHDGARAPGSRWPDASETARSANMFVGDGADALLTDGTVVHPIEAESYRILAERIDLDRWPPLSRAVVARVVHASADVSFADSLVLEEDTCAAVVRALRSGAPVVADVEMVAVATRRAGTVSLLAEGRGRAAHDRAIGEPGITVSAAAMREAADRWPTGAVVVVGNAPTALVEALALVERGRFDPVAVIGLPVGFVGAAESKAALRASGLPAISNAGERGGSAVAAAALNALWRLAQDATVLR